MGNVFFINFKLNWPDKRGRGGVRTVARTHYFVA